MLVNYFNLDTFSEETMPEHIITDIPVLYRVAVLEKLTPPCVIIQTRQNDEIHMVKLIGPLENEERWLTDVVKMLEHRFFGTLTKVVVGTYYHHREIYGVPGIKGI